MFRRDGRQYPASRWVRLLGLLRVVALALLTTQLVDIVPTAQAIAVATEALADDCGCCDHESDTGSASDCGADCDSDCPDCSCPNGIRSLPATPHGHTTMTFASEESLGFDRVSRAPPGPDPYALFRPPRTQPLA
ncbi:MAG TPA: hypothetical protein VJN18_02600 [Polyangiaceae bacterium]|nr:hypothetical protein [Polyangiaceae bacterium]